MWTGWNKTVTYSVVEQSALTTWANIKANRNALDPPVDSLVAIQPEPAEDIENADRSEDVVITGDRPYWKTRNVRGRVYGSPSSYSFQATSAF